ncbi:hypothetical protein EN781_00415 [Mesorhizobium sp. M4A.F.Ca.ET.090.04.2.1]|uniref:hypothetical protein n=1 Tax=Mesorhizobium sp. M4A.F.Ca.ET.090.04.2.1 TaxID=2496663 RepID=UPI000FCC925A|nr:hypothetical protein [Mesorhizobium sp. M4A.F.Ca.ET.090.04.2.1]RVC47632.1 hypothetical protein EN781_00415 [Mesorhizobium sp. M4A.F.Ca.ET.090.04.2.1]
MTEPDAYLVEGPDWKRVFFNRVAADRLAIDTGRVVEPLYRKVLEERLCELCGRHIMARPETATGWRAQCGNRLTRLEECGTAPVCKDKGPANISR